MSNGHDDLPAIPGTLEVLPAIHQGAALIRIENEVLIQAAIQRPRDEAKIVTAALKELELVPEQAAKAFYSIPYKERQKGGGFRVIKVEGPSIKAAMSLARRWGNCTVTARILNEDDTGWDVEGVFIDLETSFRLSRPQRVTKYLKRRDGSIDFLSPERQVMVLQSGASKAIRNATLAALPPYLVEAYLEKAKAIVGGKLDAVADQKTINAVTAAFTRLNVTPEELHTYVGLPAEKWTGTEVADLRGLWNAISDGQVTVEEIFRAAVETTATVQQPQSKQEAGATDNSTPPTPIPANNAAPLLTRSEIWAIVVKRAGGTSKAGKLLAEYTGKQSMAALNEDEVMALAKEIGDDLEKERQTDLKV